MLSSSLLLSPWLLPLALGEEGVFSLELEANETLLVLCCGCIGGFVCGTFIKAAIPFVRPSRAGAGVGVLGVCGCLASWVSDEFEMKVELARLKMDFCFFRSR